MTDFAWHHFLMGFLWFSLSVVTMIAHNFVTPVENATVLVVVTSAVATLHFANGGGR